MNKPIINADKFMKSKVNAGKFLKLKSEVRIRTLPSDCPFRLGALTDIAN
jgi:hypothetical protein